MHGTVQDYCRSGNPITDEQLPGFDVLHVDTIEADLTKTALIGWLVSLVGSAVWIYGYFVTGTPPITDWHAHSPWWIAVFLPNLQSEFGMVLACAGTAVMYWPSRR